MLEELETFIKVNGLSAKVFACDKEVHTAAKAAAVMEGDPESVAKSILLVDSEKEPVLVVLLGKDKISFDKIKVLLGVKDVQLAEPNEVLEMTGYEVGGVPPISIYGVKVIVDESVTKKEEVVCGGGDPEHLMKISVKEILESNEDVIIEDVKK